MSPKEVKYGNKIANNIFFIRQLDNLGIDKKYLGYYLMVEIMQIMINQEIRIKSFSKQVYPIIAKKFNKTECTIERNIRNLINKCWNDKLKLKLNIFWPKEEKPCCKEFIYMIKNYITLQII